MKGYFWLILFFLIGSTNALEKPFTIIICSYNNQEWVEQNLNSIFFQDYSNYRVIYIDDCSTDKTNKKVCEYLQEQGIEDRCTLIKNKTRNYKLANLYHTIHELCHDDEIIVEVDGDDWLLHDSVLPMLNSLYQSNTVWMTYGGFRTWPDIYQYLQTQPIPKQVIKDNTFRDFAQKGHIFIALRSFYAGLFKQIKKKDLLFNGDFFSIASDIVTMVPMFEMAGQHFAKINEFVYLYNTGTELNDFKRDRHSQNKVLNIIRKRPIYHPLETAPF
jgi:glycosyltransferase involved in cell wall biosynthesis